MSAKIENTFIKIYKRPNIEDLKIIEHEIRTPLNSILGFCEIITNNELSSEKRKEYLKQIIHSSKLLLEVADGFLNSIVKEAGDN